MGGGKKKKANAQNKGGTHNNSNNPSKSPKKEPKQDKQGKKATSPGEGRPPQEQPPKNEVKEDVVVMACQVEDDRCWDEDDEVVQKESKPIKCGEKSSEGPTGTDESKNSLKTQSRDDVVDNDSDEYLKPVRRGSKQKKNLKKDGEVSPDASKSKNSTKFQSKKDGDWNEPKKRYSNDDKPKYREESQNKNDDWWGEQKPEQKETNKQKKNYAKEREEFTDQSKNREKSKSGRDYCANSNYKNQQAEEYENFRRNFKKDMKYIRVKEIEGDLFEMPKEYSLAHCVAEDMNMGSGIAVQFRQQFKRLDELYNQRVRQGGLAFLQIENRFIYYLVTKRVSNGKPTYESMWSSLKCLKAHIEEDNIKKLAIPRIGCGLDRLEWHVVKGMLEYLFKDLDLEIVVCNFQQTEDEPAPATQQQQKKSPNYCYVKHVELPLVEIESGTAIVYFGTAEGDTSEEIESLSTKFKDFFMDYKRSCKQLGSVIQTWSHNKNFAQYGCIVRKKKDDRFDFLSFKKCIDQLKKLNNKNDKFYYVAIQAFMDVHDDLTLFKVINMLKYSMREVDIYVCWPKELAFGMPRKDFS